MTLGAKLLSVFLVLMLPAMGQVTQCCGSLGGGGGGGTTVTLATGQTLPLAAATSYSNFLGTGDRRNSVTHTSTSSLWSYVASGATAACLFDGDTTTNCSFPTGTHTGKYFQFSLLYPYVINEFKITTELANDQATWQLSGSNDGINFTNIDTPKAFGSTNPHVVAVTNTAPYKHYRWTGSSGTITNTWWREVEFKIGQADATATIMSVAGAQTMAWDALSNMYLKVGSVWNAVQAFSSLLTPASVMTTSAFDTETTTGTLNPNARSIVKLSDAALTAVWDATNTAWTYYNGDEQVYPPPTTSWTWQNQSTSTITQSGKALVLAIPASATNNARTYYRTIPSAPYTIEAGFKIVYHTGNFCGGGIALRDGVGGGLILFQMVQSGQINISKWTNDTSFSADYSIPTVRANETVWIKINDNNTNRVYSISVDGKLSWFQLLSTTRTDFLTPTQWGIFASSANSQPVQVTLLSARNF